MNITRFLPVISMIFLLWEHPVFPQIKKPVDPHTPSVDLKKRKSVQFYPVFIDFPRDKKIRGNVIFNFMKIRVPGKENGGTRYIKISDIKSIDFLKWSGKEYRKNSYLFKPSTIKITLNDGSSLTIEGNIPRLNRISFLSNGRSGKRRIYSLFYDYFTKGKWVNSGRSEKSYPEENPHRETLVRIQFLETEKKDILTEEILKFIKK